MVTGEFDGRAAALSGEPGEKLSETMYRTLLDMIVFGKLQNLSRLLPSEIAAHFNVSPTPVREALFRLAAEGYLEAIPRRGFHIRRPTAAMVLDAWQVRRGLEITAGELMIERLVAGSLTGASIDRLSEVQQKIEASFANADSQGHTELNSVFHRMIVEMSGNRLLLGIYDSAQTQALRAWVKRGSAVWLGRREPETREHRAIIDALAAHDPAALRETVRAHLSRSMRDAMADLNAVSPLDAAVSPGE